MREQDRWADHAAFMNGLVDDGFVIVGGPLGEGLNFLLMIVADDEEGIHGRLAEDPWTPMGLLRVAKVEPWEIVLGEGLVPS